MIEQGFFVLQWIFLACQPNSPVQDCVAMLSQDPLVQEWASHLAELNIKTTPTVHMGDDQSQDKESQSSAGILTSMSRMNNVLGDIAQNLKAIHTKKLQEAAKKTPGWGGFDDAKKAMFLCFASWDA